MKLRLGITITGFAGSGSTTLGRKIADVLSWPRPFYAGGIVRFLADKMEKTGRALFLARSDEEIVRDITEALKSGEVPARPNIADEYRTFPSRLDLLVDEIQIKLLEELDCGIHEGRVAWFLANKLQREGRAIDKKFFHILCTVHPDIGAERQLLRPENAGKSKELLIIETSERLRLERERYYKLYQIKNHLDPSNFDVIIDTTCLTQEECLDRSLEKILARFPQLAEFIKK
jgi:cytidylate kinase